MTNKIVFVTSFITFCTILYPKEGISQFISHEDLWRNLTTSIDSLQQSILTLDGIATSINDRITEMDTALSSRISAVDDAVVQISSRFDQFVGDSNANMDAINMVIAELSNNISVLANTAPTLPDYAGIITKLEYNNELWKKNFRVIKNAFEKNKKMAGGGWLPTIALPMVAG